MKPAVATAPRKVGPMRRRPSLARRLLGYAAQLFEGGADSIKVRTLDALARGFVDRNGRATPELDAVLQEIERVHGDAFDRPTMRRFQQLLADVGVKPLHPIDIPLRRTPYQLLGPQPYRNFRSNPRVPEAVDIVIVGAGLTGSSAALHLAGSGLKVAVVDRGDPAGEASGKNGRNFQTYPENFLGVYQGMVEERAKLIRKAAPDLDRAIVTAVAEREARAILGFTGRNVRSFLEIVEREKIDVHLSQRGQYRIAESAEEARGIEAEVAFGKEIGIDHVTMLSPAEMKQATRIDNQFGGRYTNDGNYDPVRFVNGMLKKGLERGVELYTRTGVNQITRARDGTFIVRTARGTIRAKQVIMATNGFTRELLPELSAIEPYQSTIMVTEHAPVTHEGTLTRKAGLVYAHYARDENRYEDPALARATGGALTHRAPHIEGGGRDKKIRRPGHSRILRKDFDTMLADRDAIAPELHGYAPSRMHTGTMGFTPDNLPAIGVLRPGLIIAAAYNGYGGSYATGAGEAAAYAAIHGEMPAWVPTDLFDPRRLLGMREAPRSRPRASGN